MPRKKQPTGTYFYVYVMSYASAEVKERIERGGQGSHAQAGDITANLTHMSTSEYKSGMAFFRACRSAMRNLLAYEVLIQAGTQTIADVTIKH